MTAPKHLDELAARMKALTATQKLTCAIEMLNRDRPDLAEAFVVMVADELAAVRLFPKGKAR